MASISSCMTLGGRHHWEGLRSKAYASPVCAAAQPLSVDHKPNSKEERQRIENAGGVVVWAGTWRVGGVLAVSRAFGDKPLKRYVIATPDIREESLRDDDEFLILASDGLWDVISNQAAFTHCARLALKKQSRCPRLALLKQLVAVCCGKALEWANSEPRCPSRLPSAWRLKTKDLASPYELGK
eukprot:2846-Pelagomonas_calceolata.AAC.2